MSLTIDICKRCGKTVVKENALASSDLIRIELRANYMCDQSPRPTLEIEGEICSECLGIEIAEFQNKIYKVKPSNILPASVIAGSKHKGKKAMTNIFRNFTQGISDGVARELASDKNKKEM